MGAGNDTVTITTLGTAATVDAGDGTADVLKMAGSDAATASATTTFAAQISNFERLSLTAFDATTVDLGNLDDISYVTIAGTTSSSISSANLNNLASGGTIINNAGATSYTVAVKNATTGTADVLNLSTTSATASVVAGAVTANGVETINVAVSDTEGDATTAVFQHTLTLNDTSLKTITVTGDAGLALTNTNTTVTSFSAAGVTTGDVTWTAGALAAAATIVGGAGHDALSATSATKNVSMEGGAGVDTLTGGAGNDTITDTSTYTGFLSDLTTSVTNRGNSIVGGAGNDTITAGDGNDTIDGGTGNDSITAGAGNDTITSGGGNDWLDAGDGIDTITLTSGDNYVTAGAGADTVTGGAGNDTILGGAGADSIMAGAGNDSIDGGDDNDSINFLANNLDAYDVVNGGGGTNTLSFSATGTLVDTDFTGVTNIQKLATDSGIALTATLGTYAKAAGVATVTGSSEADTITFSSTFTNAATVALGSTASNIDTVSASASAMALTVTATSAALGGAVDVLTGGTGTGDILSITVDSATGFSGASITGFETINITGTGSTAVAFTADTLAVAVDKTVKVDASTLANDAASLTLDVHTSAGTFSIYGGSGNDAIVLTGSTGNNLVDGGAGADSITAGAGIDNLSGGLGIDTFIWTDTDQLTSSDTVAGGDGVDILSISDTTSTVVDSAFTNISSVATLTFTGTNATTAVTLGALAQAAGLATINTYGYLVPTTSSGVDTITVGSGFTNALRINMVDGAADKIIGSGSAAALNVVYLTLGPDSADSISGGTSTGDTLTLTAAGSSNLTLVSGFETIALSATAGTYSITTANNTVASGKTLTIDSASRTGVLNFDGTAETNGYFNITSGSGALGDTIIGGSMADTITAGAGADTITGGAGADVIDLGSDTDVDAVMFTGGGFETGSVSPAVIYWGGSVDAGISISTTAMDKVINFAAGDKIITAAGGTATSTDNGVGLAWTAYSGFLKGTYDATANTFTFSTTGTSTLFAYDFDGDATTNDIRGVVLVGYVDSGTADTMISGLVAVA
jgi:Ca2+-binding RTX toxin-like protein